MTVEVIILDRAFVDSNWTIVDPAIASSKGHLYALLPVQVSGLLDSPYLRKVRIQPTNAPKK